MQPQEFEQLDPKTKYMLLQRAQEAWQGQSMILQTVCVGMFLWEGKEYDEIWGEHDFIDDL